MTVTQRETMSVRVRRRIRLAPLAVWSSILGALSGALASVLFVRPGWLLFFWLRPLYQLLLMGMIVLVPALLLAPWLGSRCQRPGHVYLAGQCYCSLYVWALLLVSATLGPGATAGLTLTTLVSVLGAGLVVGVAGGLANLLLLLVNRTFLFLVLEQDGSLCGHCGYQVGAPPATPRCPECGTLSRAQARPAPRWSRALRSSGHWAALALFCVLATAIMAHRFVVEGAETRAFLRAFGGSDRMFEGAILGEGGRGAWESVGVYQELPARPGQIVMILYDATREPGEPAMQVRLGTLTRTPGGHLFPADASPCVMSSLDEQQAEYATAKGIPPSLIQELIDVAAAAGWPAAGRPAPPVTVDAAPHFPAAVAASAPPDAAPAPPSVLRPGPPVASPGLQWADLRRSLGSGRSGRPGNAALAVLLLLSAAWLVGGLLLLRRVKRALRARASCRACGHRLSEALDTGPRCPACRAMLADVGVTLPGRLWLVAASLACVLAPVVTFLALWNVDRCVRTIRVIFGARSVTHVATIDLWDPAVEPFLERVRDPQQGWLDVFVGPLSFTQPSGRSVLWEGVGVYRILPGDEPAILNISFNPHPPEGCPKVQLNAQALVRAPSGRLDRDHTRPALTSSLADKQVEHLMQNGIPESLIDVLLETARKPAPPPGGTGLPATVSPDDHFPVR